MSVEMKKLILPDANGNEVEFEVVDDAARSDVNVLDARMDTFASLTDGSTTGDAELIDIRVGADGTTYSTAGDAVRGQTNSLKSDLDERTTEISIHVNDIERQLEQADDVLQSNIDAERIRAEEEEARIESLFSAPTQEAVNLWLNEHPEATTTVQDESITEEKINSSLKEWIREGTVNVKDFDAVGDGIADDTTAVQNAINASNGQMVYFEDGVYLVGKLTIPENMYLRLAPTAVIKSKQMTINDYLFNESSSGSNVLIEGGTIDFNADNHASRPYGFILYLPHDTQFIMRGTLLNNIQRYGFYIHNFGGYFEMSNCEVRNQAQATTENNESISAIVICSNGEAGHKGLFRFNHNRCYGVDNATLPGGAPGGVFLSCRDQGVTAHGNESTAEFIGNYFYGYGGNHGTVDISPIHFYPHWGGARVIGNYFEKCSFCAISAKSVTDCIISNNVIMNGQWTSVPQEGETAGGNIITEGAISYVSGYMGWGQSRPRGIITGNIVRSSGGQVGIGGQCGIAVRGATMTDEHGELGTTYADNVIVANNLVSDVGYSGIFVDMAIDVNIHGNTLESVNGVGIRVAHLKGKLAIRNNDIECTDGGIYYANDGNDDSNSVIVDGNNIKAGNESSVNANGVGLRGVELISIRNNIIEMYASTLYAVRILAANGVNIGLLDYDGNTIATGIVSYALNNIAKVNGMIEADNTPSNFTCVPYSQGVRFLNKATNVLYLSDQDGNWIAQIGEQFGKSKIRIRGYGMAQAGDIFSQSGDGQVERYAGLFSTTNATATNICRVNGNVVTIPYNFTYLFNIRVVARGFESNDYAAWEIKGVLHRNATGQSYTYGVTTTLISASSGASGWSISNVAGGSNGALNIMATGEASKTIRWVSQIDFVEVGNGL